MTSRLRVAVGVAAVTSVAAFFATVQQQKKKKAGSSPLGKKAGIGGGGGGGISTLHERFRSFASLDGGTQMAVEDFFDSLALVNRGEEEEAASASTTTATSTAKAKQRKAQQKRKSLALLEKLMKRFDTDNDGQLSFDEYCLFFSFLSNSKETFRTAFHMFDKDGSNQLDFDEFQTMMKALSSDPTAKLHFPRDSLLMKHFFGKQLDQSLPLNKFMSLVEELRNAVRRVEFSLFQDPSTGKVPFSEVRNLFLRDDGQQQQHQQQSKPEEGAKEKQRQRQKLPELALSLESYDKLSELLLSADVIARAMQIYMGAKYGKRGGLKKTPQSTTTTTQPTLSAAAATSGSGNAESAAAAAAANKGLDRREFLAAIQAAAPHFSLSPSEFETLFRLLDSDGSGTIDPQEFARLGRMKASFSAAFLPDFDIRRNFVQQFHYCMFHSR